VPDWFGKAASGVAVFVNDFMDEFPDLEFVIATAIMMANTTSTPVNSKNMGLGFILSNFIAKLRFGHFVTNEILKHGVKGRQRPLPGKFFSRQQSNSGFIE